MRVNVYNILLLIWSCLPVFALTKDKNYGEHVLDNNASFRNQLKEWRFSIVQIMCGTIKIYIFSFVRKYNATNNSTKLGFEPFKILSLDKICCGDDHIKKISDDYYNRLTDSSQTISDNRKQIEKESLCYHIENQSSRIEKSDNKMNVYTTVALTVLPILLGISCQSLFEFFKINFIHKLAVVLSAYFIINILIYLFQYIRVRNYITSNFKDLKNEANDTLEDKLISQYYFDFQSIKNKAELFVSYVKNIQRWMIVSLFLFVGVVIYHQAYTTIAPKNQNPINTNSLVYNIDLKSLNDPYSISSSQLTDIRKSIQVQSADKIIILYNIKSDISLIKEELKVFDSTFDIQYVNDDQLDSGSAKIILYNERTP